MTIISNIKYIDATNKGHIHDLRLVNMGTEYPEVMTISEICKYLRIPRSSLYKLAQEGKIPCQKVGRHWRFRRAAIDRWLEENPFRDLPQKIASPEELHA